MRLATLALLLHAPAPGLAFSLLGEEEIKPVAVASERLPRLVAVLPFANDTEDPAIAEEVRRAFYNHFSSKPYSDIELLAIDDKWLAQGHAQATATIQDYQALCRDLGCDGVVSGRVSKFRKVFAGLYSELSVSAAISLINTREGTSLVSHQDDVAYRDGGISLSPIGLAMTALSAARNVSDVQRMRLVNELAHNLTQAVPDPEGSTARPGPRIKELLSNAAESPIGLGKPLHVGMEGDPGGVAVFDIGQARRGIPMQEKTPGVYIGEYRVQEGDALRQATIRVSLRARNGLETQWIDTNPVSMDSEPPIPPEDINARSLPGRVELSWHQTRHVPDLAAFNIERSSQPLAGYQTIGTANQFSYQDETATVGIPHFYRIVGVDQAGNTSVPSRAVEARVLPTGVTQLQGPITNDTELGGAYLITDTLVIEPGARLRLLPGSQISFAAKGRLFVKGSLFADGQGETVRFASQGEQRWRGILVAGGKLDLRDFAIQGAETGLALQQQAQAILQNGQIRSCSTGLDVDGEGTTEIKSVQIANNQTGVRLSRSTASLSRNTIANNELGVAMSTFIGTFRDNSLLHNTVNLRAEPGTLLDVNYWGSLDPSALRIEGGLVKEALSRPAPDGRVVAVRANPLANLSQDARLEKVTEWTLEAGRLFKARNFGRAASLFDQILSITPSADIYYFAALSQVEMQDTGRALDYLSEGVVAFPSDPALRRALGMLHYQRGDASAARTHLQEALRLAPSDKQAAFILNRLEQSGEKAGDATQ